MTARRDLDRVLTAWLNDELGPVEAPSYFGETLDLIDRTPQRRVWPWSGLAVPRRWTRMDMPAGAWVALVVALLLVALVVAALSGAFQLRPPPVPTGPGRILVTSDGDLTVINPDGGFTKPSETPAAETMSSFSPDGRRIAYWTWVVEDLPDGSQETTVPLSVMNADGTGQVQLLDGVDPPTFTVEGPPAWSPDGRFIVFGASGRLYTIEVDTRVVTAVADDGLHYRAAPTWSPNGAWIAFHASPPQTQPVFRPIGSIHVIRPDGSEETVVSGEMEVWGGNFGPQWSADSNRLAYVTPDGDAQFSEGIAIATLDQGRWNANAVPGVEGLHDQVMLSWAPRGNRLVYTRELPSTDVVEYELTLIDEALTLRPITDQRLAQGFCWSPDATKIAAVTSDQHLVAIDVATGTQLDDFGVTQVNVGDACVWSAWAGEPR
jgi:hypothetical protein